MFEFTTDQEDRIRDQWRPTAADPAPSRVAPVPVRRSPAARSPAPLFRSVPDVSHSVGGCK